EICKNENIDFLLAVGGGSVIDAAKAIALGACYDGDVWDFYEHKAKPEKALSLGSVLTLAATGSEMNGNSVITKEETQRKLAVGYYILYPQFSILDPEYTYTVNAYHTAAGIADIMAHIFEQYFSHTQATDVQDRIAEGLLKVCIKYGPIAIQEPNNYEARANILWAGTLALNSLIGNGKIQDWATHIIEHELSAYYDISHGAGLAVLFPQWLRFVLNNKTLPKFLDYAKNVWDIYDLSDEYKAANLAINKTAEFFKSLGLPIRLKDMNIDDKLFEKMAENTIEFEGADGYIGSFKKLSKSDIIEIYKNAL
ncbi:MAG TPA: iron-containing alcohol dehydrogenase, partial [bacterium]|nr:iron-containing alcohol dehydrogenase [bacterium]